MLPRSLFLISLALGLFLPPAFSQGTFPQDISVSSSITLDSTHMNHLVLATGGGSGITLTLPANSSWGDTYTCLFRVDSGAGDVTIARAGADTINGATSITLPTQFQHVCLYADGAGAWEAFGTFIGPGAAVGTGRTITGGAGVAAMGDLSADRTVNVGAGTGITVNADDVQLSYSNTLAGNPALNVEECTFTTDGVGGGGFLCEGTTANTNEQLYLFPAVDGADTTNFIVVHGAQVTAIDGASLTVTSGTLDCDAASLTAAGCVELATAAETTTGTDATRAVTPDGLAGSDFGKRIVEVIVFNTTTTVTTGDNKVLWKVPTAMVGMNLVSVQAQVSTVSSSGAVNVDLARCAAVATGNACSGTVADMLSTNLTIDANEDDSDTAATAAVIDAANDDIAQGQSIRIDVDVAGTGTQGLVVVMEFQLP